MSIPRFPSLLGLVLSICLAVSVAQAQTQASCAFMRFPLTFIQPSGTSVSLTLAGINDFGTVVGTADLINNGSGSAVPFIRWSNGGITFPLGKRAFGSLADRNDSGVSIGYDVSIQTSFILMRDGTFIPIPPITAGGFTNNVPIAAKINKWDSVVGDYALLAGQTVGFKRWKNGSVVSLDNPWIPLQTHLAGINDSGVIVGTAGGNYGPQLSHGLIYHKGSWAQLDYPGGAFTRLTGISNSGLIIGNGNTSASQFGPPTTPFLYENGAFKIISPPNTLPGTASVTGISLKLGMIVGSALNLNNKPIGFIAKCQ